MVVFISDDFFYQGVCVFVTEHSFSQTFESYFAMRLSCTSFLLLITQPGYSFLNVRIYKIEDIRRSDKIYNLDSFKFPIFGMHGSTGMFSHLQNEDADFPE